MRFEIVHKPKFTTQLLALPPRVWPQIMEKIQLLAEDPSPHAPVKKRLHAAKNAYRLRSGDYRVLYTYGDGWVALLGVDKRDDVYDNLGNLLVEAPSATVKGVPELDDLLRPADPPQARSFTTSSQAVSETDDDLLPVQLDAELLGRLRVPEECIPALSTCRTLTDLLDARVPESVRMLVFEAATAPDLDRVLQQPTYVTGDVSDLLKFAEGELLGFLLKLNPEQEKFVTWAVRGSGPTLVKGGPGTGKSTIALYRTKALIERLRAEGVSAPRILFTTYTNALVSFSRQLLTRLLGPDAAHVEIRTADGLVREIVERADGRPDIIDHQQLPGLLQRAVTEARFDGNALQRRAQGLALERLTPAYLLEEIETVIVARELTTLDEYLETPRAGREVGLNGGARTAVWRVHEALTRILAARRQVTWSRLRARAAALIRAGAGPAAYDGVIVDEAQDLEPTVLRALVGLSRSPDRLFVTADANQSIYGSGFRWTDVHEDLRFRGRTGLLRTNHRSTEEIGEAAHAYLAGGAIDEDGERREYAERGALPAVRAVASAYDQIQLLARYLSGASRELRLGLGACAVLAPSREMGRAIAGELSQLDVPATFMPGDSLELDAPCVKVLTLKSAKGLEFPIVTLAGFLDDPEPGVPRRGDSEERLEALRRERRTMFVGMTRAMRALLLVTPADKRSELLDGFDARYWNLA